jgi:hypothetical protein
MSSDMLEREKQKLTPQSGFNLVGIDPFASAGDKLYLVEHFEKYQEALQAKKEKDNPDEYLILYPGAS